MSLQAFPLCEQTCGILGSGGEERGFHDSMLIIGFLNEAALFYKNRHCEEGGVNLKKEISLRDLPE